jgi:sugar phosphate isomerase/epimerase
MIIGISTMLFEKNFSEQYIKAIQQIGIKYIELSDSHGFNLEVIDIIKNNNLNIFSIHAPFLNSDISGIDKKRRLDGIIDIKKIIDIAEKINSKLVIVHPGPWCIDKMENKLRLENCIHSLFEVTNYAYSRNVKIAIENLPQEFLGDNLEDLAYILNSIQDLTGHKNSIGICLDTGHAFLTNNLYEVMDFFKNEILSIHIQDNFGDNNKDRSLVEDDIHCLPGYGKINWDYFFDRLDCNNYKGGLIFEIKATSLCSRDELFVLGEIKNFIEAKKLN